MSWNRPSKPIYPIVSLNEQKATNSTFGTTIYNNLPFGKHSFGVSWQNSVPPVKLVRDSHSLMNGGCGDASSWKTLLAVWERNWQEPRELGSWRGWEGNTWRSEVWEERSSWVRNEVAGRTPLSTRATTSSYLNSIFFYCYRTWILTHKLTFLHSLLLLWTSAVLPWKTLF